MATPQLVAPSVVGEALSPERAAELLEEKLKLLTDPSDVWSTLKRNPDEIVVLDARSADKFAATHIRGALNLPYRDINEHSVAALDRTRTIVTYCTGVGCNASTKAAVRLAKLGFKVKELDGGLTEWSNQHLPVEQGSTPLAFNPKGDPL